MKNFKKLSKQIKKEQIITKQDLKNLKGGFWGNFVYKGGGRCKLCPEDDTDY